MKRNIALKASNTSVDDVLSNQDLAIGILLAFTLAFVASFLQNRRNQSDFVLSQDATYDGTSNKNATTTTYNDWKEMAKADNYVWYKQSQRNSTSAVYEEPWVLVALLALFTPIFSFEFLLTFGRQVACFIDPSLCAPV